MLGPASIEADLALGNDPISCTVGAVLRQASHLLGPIAPDAALDATLLTRIKQEPTLTTLAETFEPTLPRPYLAALGQLPDMPEPALRRVLTGHTDTVYALAVDPAGRWLASAGDDATVRIWDPDTGSPRHVLTGHGDWVRTLAVDPAGRWLASVGDDRAVRIYRVSAEETCALRVDSRLYLCAFLPDAGVLLAAGERGPYFLEIVT
ncbi:MAG: WD40 repeat domain-containing protein [Frankiaceae bacterium]